MEISEWQKFLADTFHTDGIVGASLIPVVQAERRFGTTAANTYHGYFYLSSSFQSFLLDTLHAAEKIGRRLPVESPFAWYRPVLLSFVGVFRVSRAAENLFTSGYPLNGYGLLRDLKDRALAYGAILSGLTSFRAVNAWDIEAEEGKYTYEHFRKARRQRQKQDLLIHESMIGEKSGLSENVRQQLSRWNEMFHSEVHGGRLTFALQGAQWLVGKSKLPITPSADELNKSIGMFTHRYQEVVALLVRVLPYLQAATEPFDDEWRRKWKILSDYLIAVFDYQEQAGQEITPEFKVLLSTKFPFDPETTFYRE